MVGIPKVREGSFWNFWKNERGSDVSSSKNGGVGKISEVGGRGGVTYFHTN